MAEEVNVGPGTGNEVSVPKEKKATPEDVVTRWPLYEWFEFPEFEPPDRITFGCDTAPNCSKQATTTWAVSKRADVGFHVVEYQCTLCGKRGLFFAYVVSQTSVKVLSRMPIRK